jgi:glycosyltransferase involved in cell wall biosynthesis
VTRRILVCASQIPFNFGGAEILVETLTRELRARGFAAEIVRLPFAWGTREQIFESALAWRLLDLTRSEGREIDLVIATRFPSYVVRHPNKVVWLIHQFRQAYDLLESPYRELDAEEPRDRRTVEMVRRMDRRTLSEARALYTIAGNTSARLKRFNDLDSTPLYPPPQHGDGYRSDGFGDYVLGVGRLDRLKRFDLLVRALEHTGESLRCVIAGSGPEEERLRELVRAEGLGGRVELAGFVSDERLLELYAGCRAVFFAPFDEDYGYVTVEAFKAGKPVVTCADAGAVLEFVGDGVNGFVCPPDDPQALAAAFDRLAASEELARTLGERGRRTVAGIGWDAVVEALTATL